MPGSDRGGGAEAAEAARGLLCPSGRPEPGSVVFAVRTGDESTPGVAYLDAPVPTSAEVLALAEPVDPREVFRFASPCAESGCVHFDGARCRLGGRVATQLPPIEGRLPACHIRSRCRWFAERGADACRRCPLVITRRTAPSADYAEVVLPAG